MFYIYFLPKTFNILKLCAGSISDRVNISCFFTLNDDMKKNTASAVVDTGEVYNLTWPVLGRFFKRSILYSLLYQIL